MWLQRDLTPRAPPARLPPRHARGARRLPELGDLRAGLCHLFLRHTSASLTLNENASPDVRRDFETWFDAAVPEGFAAGRTRSRGPTTCPRTSRPRSWARRCRCPSATGALALGTWQGVNLCEHRDHGGAAVAAGDAARRRAGRG